MAEQPQTASPTLPSSTLDFAHRIFNAARSGDAPLLLQAIDAGLPINLTNAEGAYVFRSQIATIDVDYTSFERRPRWFDNREHPPDAHSLCRSHRPHTRPPHAQRRSKPSQRPRSIHRRRCRLQGARRDRSRPRRRGCRSETRKANGDRDRPHVWTQGSVGGPGCQRG